MPHTSRWPRRCRAPGRLEFPMRTAQILVPMVLACLCAEVQAKDPCVSGLQVGQRPGPYSFLVASGPERGQLTCYVCETAEKPAVIVFTRSVSEPLAKLVAACDGVVGSKAKEGVRGWMTVLGEKSIAVDDLGKWAKQAGLKTMPVGVF